VLLAALGNATNITVLAPSNEALAVFLNSSAGTATASIPSAVEALLTYHVLNGTYPATAFTNTSQFIPTFLINSSYTNVTGGQRVEAVLNGTNVEIFSGLLQKSTVTTAVSFRLNPHFFLLQVKSHHRMSTLPAVSFILSIPSSLSPLPTFPQLLLPTLPLSPAL
jgi:hypothetical protein